MDENYEDLRAQLAGVRRYLHKYHRLTQEDAEHGLTQADIGRKMFLSQTQLSRLEHGDPPISHLARYVAALGGRLEVRAVAADNFLRARWPVESLPTRERIPRSPRY